MLSKFSTSTKCNTYPWCLVLPTPDLKDLEDNFPFANIFEVLLAFFRHLLLVWLLNVCWISSDVFSPNLLFISQSTFFPAFALNSVVQRKKSSPGDLSAGHKSSVGDNVASYNCRKCFRWFWLVHSLTGVLAVSA